MLRPEVDSRKRSQIYGQESLQCFALSLFRNFFPPFQLLLHSFSLSSFVFSVNYTSFWFYLLALPLYFLYYTELSYI